MEKMNGYSLDIVKENVSKLKEIFPEVFCEDKVDFERLQEVLGEYIEDKEERYRFEWHGKSQAIRMAQTPSRGTLRPCKEESKNWDTTENLYIEGDNLEVLKLLQKSYQNKIKMIYIDPPYNTGNDFVYKDDYKDNLKNYLEITGQVDEEGNKTSTNSEKSGRYHTNWLNMMYPRLRLAKNLLTEDGVIFISIDEKEVTSLTSICNEIFGELNHLETFHIKVRYENKSLNEDSDFQPVMEYVLIYAKNRLSYIPQKPSESYDLSKFIYSFSELTEGETLQIANKTVTIFKNGEWKISKSDEGKIGLLKETWASGSIVKQSGTAAEFLAKYLIDRKPLDGLGVLYKIHNMGEDGLGYRYVTGPLKEDAIRGKFYSGVPLERTREIEAGISLKYKPIVNFYDYSGGFGNIRHEGGVAFNSGKKPIKMLQHLMFTANLKPCDIVLDFFSGSASTAHALMDYNQSKNMNFKFIMVQLPEPIDEKSEAFKAGYKNIWEIGKERIRRAGDKIVEENKDKEGIKDLDIGFKVFKLDSSNIKPWNPSYENIANRLDEMVDNFVEDRIEEDVVYEIMLKYGIDLTYPIEVREISGKKVFSIGFGALIICLDNEITLDVVNGIVDLKNELSPEITRIVFKDNGFKTDSVKTNAIEILKRNNINEVMSI
ncbi:site-specific DNA-methyltransferase [uncultured Clostridium sp.]|uniref:site-specific DNA-methyltransferase n=1 Tax=uncultured Clostridium sp. TaxID=59620 RepID=UPI0028E7AA0C|nr:site-specific DNA-methyltransferase [uncultured Clostridium sp.]